MTEILTARFGKPYADRTMLLPATSIERHARLGRTMTDGPRARWNRAPLAIRRLDFPPVHATFLADVELFSGHILRGADAVYLDNAVDSLLMRTEAEAELLGDRLLGKIAEAEAQSPQIVEIDAPVLLTANEGSCTWGHWLIQIFPGIAVAARAMPELRILVPSAYFGHLPSFGAVLTEFGIGRNRLVPVHDSAIYRLKSCVLIDNLYHRRAIHPHSLSIFAGMREIPALRQREVHRQVAIERTPDSFREVANQDVFAAAAARHGYVMQKLGALPFAEQIDHWRTADRICGVMGSDFANLVFAPSDLSVTVLTPAWFGDDFFFDLAAARGVVWNELFCNTIGLKRHPRVFSSFAVDPEKLDEILKE